MIFNREKGFNKKINSTNELKKYQIKLLPSSRVVSGASGVVAGASGVVAGASVVSTASPNQKEH